MTVSGAIDRTPVSHASFCQAAKPIRWSKKDTPETIEQVQEHNAVGATLCSWK